MLEPGTITEAEVALLRRMLFAKASDGPGTISRAEAELLFRIKDLTLHGANAPEWRALFVQNVANSLKAHNDDRPFSRILRTRSTTTPPLRRTGRSPAPSPRG